MDRCLSPLAAAGLCLLAACAPTRPAAPGRGGQPPFRVSLSVSPFTELVLAGGATWTDGTRTAASVEALQRLFMAHGATEVFARIGTRRTLPGADGVDASLARGLERARLAQRLGVPLNPELSLFGSYGDLSCQTAPDFSEYPEIVLPGPWGSLGIDDRAAALRSWAQLAASALLATGVKVEFWDLGNEVDFGVAGVAVQPLAGSACDAAEGTTTWYGPPDRIDPAQAMTAGARCHPRRRRHPGCRRAAGLSWSRAYRRSAFASVATNRFTRPARALREPGRAPRETMALPTTTPSASEPSSRACSGVETPKPITTGTGLAARTAATRAVRSGGNSDRAPVTPVTETK
jgi:hypothetical protein